MAGYLSVYLGFGHLGMADQVPQARGDETHGYDAVGRAGLEHVAGQLLSDEVPVRSVRVERADDVVAIGPDCQRGWSLSYP